MANTPSAQDVAEALAITLEREDAAGAPWCPPGDGVALRRWVSDRSASLGTGIRRAVRLADLMAVADGRDYVRFLYIRLTALRARHFRFAMEAAIAEGRIKKSFAILSDNGVHLHDPALTPQGEPKAVFEIDFVQMPRLGALLDFLHNALGFAAVAEVLGPLLQRTRPARHADDVARALQAALNAWLSHRLESANHMLQAQRMRVFLASRGPIVPNAIDDEGILSFWTMLAEAPEAERIDGFRLFRSAASAMLRYRHALQDATTAKYLEDSIAQGLEDASDNLASGQFDKSFEPWRSPLRVLMLPAASRIKWLTRKEQQKLLNYLGGPADEEDEAEGVAVSDEECAWKGGLAGEERFDLAFWLTLLRADVFGAVQASIVARLRKRATARDAIAQAMVAIDDKAYTTATSDYGELRQQLHVEISAALAVLMEAGASEAIVLLSRLGGLQAIQSVIGKTPDNEPVADDQDTLETDILADELSKQFGPLLKAAISDPKTVSQGPGRTLLLEAEAATRKVSRVGFRREDRTDKQMVVALQLGASPALEVMCELDRLLATLSPKVAASDIASDIARFHQTFRRMYLEAPDN